MDKLQTLLKGLQQFTKDELVFTTYKDKYKQRTMVWIKVFQGSNFWDCMTGAAWDCIIAWLYSCMIVYLYTCMIARLYDYMVVYLGLITYNL